MAITDLPTLTALRSKMQWHQERQRVLSENIANSDTPNFRPRDLAAPRFDVANGRTAGFGGALPMARTASGHIGPTGTTFAADTKGSFETRPAGNAVNLEDETMKVASNQMDYAAATSLYSRSLGLLKTAIGKR
jgi:flagellar basal-body rod protein FlgB